jgi:hypothetical protein
MTYVSRRKSVGHVSRVDLLLVRSCTSLGMWGIAQSETTNKVVRHQVCVYYVVTFPVGPLVSCS